MKDEGIIEGQISIFELPVIEPIKPKENAIKDASIIKTDKLDDKVNIEYQGIKSIGKVVRIYNNGETLNVAWDGKQTAFYYKNVRRAENYLLEL